MMQRNGMNDNVINSIESEREENVMLKRVDFYYFSPTGGTKKTGEILARAMAEQVNLIDLGKKEAPAETGKSDMAVFAAPVFGGRIPALTAEKLKDVDGTGKKAVTLAVYGVRAYEDALLELNDVLEIQGFQIVASGAFVAQHSIVPEVGAGRPDSKDEAEIRAFAEKILAKLEAGENAAVSVPGNRPYKVFSSMPVAPLSLPSCTKCGVCAGVCPASAIQVNEAGVLTDADACCLCMACVSRCPEKARILPPPVQEQMNQKLSALKTVRRENETYL